LKANNPDTLSTELLAANSQLAKQMTAGKKLGFCLLDAVPCQPGLGCPDNQPVDPPTYGGLPGEENSCQTMQGIDVGWADIYIITQLGQWIEVPNGGGTFVLENEINTGRGIVEKSYTNNSAAVCVNIPPVAVENGGQASSYVPDPSCVNPTAIDGLTDCQMCLFTCESFAIPSEFCPCSSLYCM